MSKRVLHVTFEHEDDLLAATETVRRHGLHIVDAYTPYAVHGLDRAMGLKPSRLTWVCFVCGMLGACGMLWFQHWVAAITWPIDVGGKPWNSLPSDVPVGFEMAVLLAGFGSVFALFFVCRLFPGKRRRPIDLRTTDDRFVLVIKEDTAAFDIAKLELLLRNANVVAMREQVEEGDAEL